jgi:hypothetical protein
MLRLARLLGECLLNHQGTWKLPLLVYFIKPDEFTRGIARTCNIRKEIEEAGVEELKAKAISFRVSLSSNKHSS